MGELTVQDITRTVGDETKIHNTSFSVKENEFFVLLGPENSGKSLLLALICGLEQPDTGRIYLNGQDVTPLPTRQRNIGFVFQEYNLYPHMDVYQNIAYGLQTRHIGTTEIERRIISVASALDLSEQLHRFVGPLSMGVQQRIALARVLVKDADAYLFDEPISSVETRLRYAVRKEISVIHRLKRKPTLYVTRDRNDAVTLADRIGIFSEGKLHQVGTVAEILERPANIFVARYFSTTPINIFYGYPQRLDVRYRILAGDINLILPPHWASALASYNHSDILFGLSAEAIIPPWELQNAKSALRQPIAAQILEIEPLLEETILRLRIGSNTEIMAQFEGDEVERLFTGQVIPIGFNAERLFLFDARTQQALLPPAPPQKA